MAIIVKGYSFGTDRCMVCDVKLKAKRKWWYACTTKCQRKIPAKIDRLLNEAVKPDAARGGGE